MTPKELASYWTAVASGEVGQCRIGGVWENDVTGPNRASPYLKFRIKPTLVERWAVLWGNNRFSTSCSSKDNALKVIESMGTGAYVVHLKEVE